MRWLVGLLVLAACGDDPHNAGPVDGPDLDAPAVDAPAIDATPIDAAVDATPIDAIDGPPALIECTIGGQAACPADQYCDLATASYCDPFSLSFCRPRPQPGSCTPAALPVCACDGQQYASACDAHAAGSVPGPGSCSPPAGHFTCGDTYCQLSTEYCAELRENTDFRRRDFECRPMPPHSGAVCPQLIAMACNGQDYPGPGDGEDCSEDASATTVHYMCVTIPF